ncbi:ABC transporter substrate-binding protein [Selenihalanaerobacter shriftii]|uniref:Sulfonate transport system substrate-binding protein n=1 Tax=Selenihalanaerobacter shriftii TaxID=142842 RepID=A0A1T4JKV8_9FIRM|nr:ABC transporter substrate-binding protein [Selenihalanaerobacter shriftii]SJZ30794.1 sulfonate transport system substrate-binding protein [Selenihalanaerobacter shriftii]
MSSNIRKLLILMLMGVLLLSAGCSSTNETKGDLKSKPKISFAYQTSVAHSLAMIADHKGFFASEGLDVNTQVLNSGPAVNEAIASGSVQFGTMGDTPALMAVAGNLPVKILSSVGGGENRQRLMVKKNSNIDSVKDLAGKTIGIKKGTSSHGGFYQLASKEGLDPDQVSIIDIRPPDMADALATDQADAILIWEPTPTVIEAKNIGRELSTLAGTNNQYPVFILANTAYAQKNKEVVIKVLKSLKKAAKFLQNNPDQAAQVVSKVTGLSPELAKKSMNYHYFKVDFNEEIKESLNNTAAFLYEYDKIQKIPKLEKVIDDSYLKQINISK